MNSNTDISQFMLWSGQMILRTLQKVLAENAYNNLPPTFIKEMEAMKTVLTLEQLKLKLEPLANICLTELGVAADSYDFEALLNDFVQIRSLEEFPMFLGLDGCVNNMASGDFRLPEPLCDRTDIDVVKTQKSVLFSAINMVNVYDHTHVNFKHCALLIGCFYADRLARKLKNTCMFGMSTDEFSKQLWKICNESLKIKITVPPSESRMLTIINSARLEKLVQAVFKGSDYYLIPEFRHELAKAKNKSDTTTAATSPQFLLNTAITFERFFEALSKYPIFCPTNFQLMKNSIMSVKIHGYSRQVLFTMSIEQLIAHNNPHMQIPSSTDPLALMDEDAFSELRSAQKIGDCRDSLVETSIHFVRKTFANPVVSPLGQLCLPAFEAVTEWLVVFTENVKFILFSKNLDEVDAYLKKSVEYFTKDKKDYLHAVDYGEFQALVKEGKTLCARENKKVTKKPIPTEIEEYETMIDGSKCANTFPSLLSVLQCFSFEEKDSLSAFSNCLRYSLWFKYPELALFAHQQKMCGVLSYNHEPEPFCYLDLIQDDEFVRPARCDHPIPPLVELLRKRRLALEEKQNEQIPEKKEASNGDNVSDHLHNWSDAQRQLWEAREQKHKNQLHKYMEVMNLLKGDIEELVAQSKVWEEKEKKYKSENDGWRKKEKEYQRKIENTRAEVTTLTSKMRENKIELETVNKLQKANELKNNELQEEIKGNVQPLFEVLRRKNADYQKTIESARSECEVNTLMSKMRESKRDLEAQVKSHDEKHKMEMNTLREEMNKLKDDMRKKEEEEEFKLLAGKGCGDSATRKNVGNAKALIKSFVEYQQEWKSQMESARIILQEFTIHSKSKFDVKVAEKELKCYELTTGGWMKMVDENIKMLKGKNVQYELLFEVKELPSTVFSGGMIEKMEKVRKEKMEEEQNKRECSICLELLNRENLFKCVGCLKEFHANCYAKWAVTSATCPLCRQINPSGDDFPPLR